MPAGRREGAQTTAAAERDGAGQPGRAAPTLDEARGFGYQGRGTNRESERPAMAVDPTGGHPAMDYPEHLRTYAGFLKATVTLIVGVAVLLLFMLFYLVP